ncbi:hypothetical protein COY07_03815 [Candidatus Peregrinibacteria bacterium CG_4_10_14_0_2_um_filter_43_11]|nr:MAG: hypothetical protein COY07_03815 [Candidatus Peregrinibacteria bacterium CG_4_10_14_0_2_um_filter_43_11]
MKVKRRFVAPLIFILCVTLLVVYGQFGSSGKVIRKFKERITEIQSVEASVVVDMWGVNGDDTLHLNADLDLALSHPFYGQKKMNVIARIKGETDKNDQNLDGEAVAELRMIDDHFFIKLDQLNFDDPGLENFKIFLEGYYGRWLELTRDFVSRHIYLKKQRTLLEEAAFKKLFVKSRLFRASEVYGTEEIDGKKVYHYGVVFNRGAVEGYFEKAVGMGEYSLTDLEIKKAGDFLATLEDVEFWIGVDDYNLYRATLTFQGNQDGMNPETQQINLVFSGKSFNNEVIIETPTETELFQSGDLLKKIKY